MAFYLYKGISQKHQAELLAAYMANVRPQDPRGRPPIYHIDQKDSEEKKEAKRALVKKYMAMREAEYKKELAGMAERVEMKDSVGTRFIFEKGKSVEVPEISSLFAKLESLTKPSKAAPHPLWEKSDKPAKDAGIAKDTKEAKA